MSSFRPCSAFSDPLLIFSHTAFSFSFGFFFYLFIEKLFKTFFSDSATHWAMGLCAGLAFLFLLCLDRFSLPLTLKALLGSLFITALELFVGLFLNLRQHLGIWDYSENPLNYKGQICLAFSLIWFAASFGILFCNRTLFSLLFFLQKRLTRSDLENTTLPRPPR